MPDSVAPFIAAPLAGGHFTQDFDCGEPALNDFLQHHALNATQAGSARTFVVAGPDKNGRQSVFGFYSLVAGHIEHFTASERATKGMPKFPIPAVILARLAVDRARSKGSGLAV